MLLRSAAVTPEYLQTSHSPTDELREVQTQHVLADDRYVAHDSGLKSSVYAPGLSASSRGFWVRRPGGIGLQKVLLAYREIFYGWDLVRIVLERYRAWL